MRRGTTSCLCPKADQRHCGSEGDQPLCARSGEKRALCLQKSTSSITHTKNPYAMCVYFGWRFEHNNTEPYTYWVKP